MPKPKNYNLERCLETFRVRVRDLLDERNMKVSDFAGEVNISLSRAYAMLRGPAAPSLESARKAADFFGCSMDYLFGFAESYHERTYRTIASVSERVKEAVDKSGLSRYQLSKETETDQSEIHAWYHGRKVPELVSLLKLVQPLNTSLDFLSGRDE